MRRYIVPEMSELAIGNSKTLLASVFFFLTGVSCGVFLELIMNPEEKGNVALYLQQYLFTNDTGITFPNPFFTSAGANLLLLLIMLISGLTAFGIPAAFIALMYKGLSLGFSAGLLIDSMALKGAGMVFISILPQNLILIPVFLFAACAAVNHSLDAIKRRKSKIKKSQKINSGPYLSLYFFLSAMVLLGCLIEGLLFPIVT